MGKQNQNLPHNIDSKMSSELNEQLHHLPQIRSISMGVQKREFRKRVFPENSNHLVPDLSFNQMNICVLVRRQPRDHHLPVLSAFSVHVVRWRVRREKRELGRHVGRHIAHLRTNYQYDEDHEQNRNWTQFLES